MCGRFTLSATAEALKEWFPLFDLPDPEPRYNIAPTQPVLVCRQNSETHQPEFVRLRWGLIPHWAEDRAIGNRMINARSESVADKPAFRTAFRRHRCLILADGFYEWQKTEGGKQPFFIRRKDGKPFAFAGLWDRWSKEDPPLETCTILTTQANELMKPLHDRMPVILDPDRFTPWLAPTETPKDLLELLQPCPSDDLTAYPISTRVNNPRNEGPECIAPLTTK